MVFNVIDSTVTSPRNVIASIVIDYDLIDDRHDYNEIKAFSREIHKLHAEKYDHPIEIEPVTT